MVAGAARAQGIKMAVYLSPADLFQLRTNPKYPGGYYGDGSSNVLSTIPTDPESFKTNPSKARTPPRGFTSYTYAVHDYNRYFLNQLYELLTQYGTIGEVWFDGANPDRSVHEPYNYAAWYDMIHKLQPNAIIFGKGPDGRWVGNENGVGRTTEWSVIPIPQSPDTFVWPDMTARDLGSRAKLTPGSYPWWYPAEVNTPILYGWFGAANKRAKSATDLINVFYQSVGRNGNMLLNLSPDKRGLIPENQLAPLRQMAQVVNDTFAADLAAGGKLSADSFNPANPPSRALDGNLDTWWEAARGQTNGTLTLTLPNPVTFDVISLQEAVDHRSQRVESFVIETWDASAWSTPARIRSDELTTVGHKRLIRLQSPATTAQVRIRITGSRLEPTLAEIGLFKQAIPVPAPEISDRNAKGDVTIAGAGSGKIVFTTNGTIPTAKSKTYGSPISLALGGNVQAAVVTAHGQLGVNASKSFPGLAPIGWKVVDADSQDASSSAVNAIDGNPSTIWRTRSDDSTLPHHITFDMAGPHKKSPGLFIFRDKTETSTESLKTTDLKPARTDAVGRQTLTTDVLETSATIRCFRKCLLIRSPPVFSVSPPSRKSIPTAGRAPPNFRCCRRARKASEISNRRAFLTALARRATRGN
jgi:alpha-L-fucosidase